MVVGVGGGSGVLGLEEVGVGVVGVHRSHRYEGKH